MLTEDLYTYERKSLYQGGSPHCMACLKPDGSNQNIENLVHIITECKAYNEVRLRILFQLEILCSRSQSGLNFKKILTNNAHLTQFILDCTSLNLPERINESEEICPIIFSLSRDLCYSIMKTRNKIIKELKK